MRRPVVGVTSYIEPARWGAWEKPAALVPYEYIERVQAAGARAIILPPDDLDVDVLDRLDGLVIIGGADVGPQTYGTEPHLTTDEPRESRDAGEIALYRGARERDLPILGICRGLQIMAVAEGGTLHQHLNDVVGDDTHRERLGAFTEHGARFADGSLAARTVGGTTAEVNSSHHQAIDDPGGLTVTGWAHDDTVETAEVPGATFVLGVQWHPEVCSDAAVGQGVFDAFVDAVRGHAASLGARTIEG